jgi:hypothetical protein
MLALSLCLCLQAPAANPSDVRAVLESALRRYFAAEKSQGPALVEFLSVSRGEEPLLEEILRAKSFVAPHGSLALRGRIDESYRFRELAGEPEHEGNEALFYGPAHTGALHPLIVYVPDNTETASSRAELEREAAAGRFVLLPPDVERQNLWFPTLHELRRHSGPLRELLLTYAIDPERVTFVGSGRGGHACWAVGLLYAERFAGIAPCNGGPVCEGSYDLSGGVFLENARALPIHAVHNTSFDHGLEGCRYAARKFAEWRYPFTGVEEPNMRTMDIAEAMGHLGDVRRASHPRTLVKRFNHLDAGAPFWLRALERRPGPWDPKQQLTLRAKLPDDPLARREALWAHIQTLCARLEAEVQADRITVTAQGVAKLRVYFDPELVPYGRPLKVVVNGKEQAPVTPKKDTAEMLRHVHETGDTSTLYWDSREYAVRN